MKKIFCNIISRHDGHWAMFTAFQNAAGFAVQNGYVPMLSPHVGDSLVSRARINSMAQFLKTDADYYFTMDDDIALPADALVKLINADKPMIGGFYRLKRNPKDGEEFSLANMLAFRGKDPFNLEDEQVVEVRYISSGCVMHTRKFIEEMIAHYPELNYAENVTGEPRCALYQPYIYKNEYLSEDWAFCQRALDKGYKLYMHTGVLCDHWGLYKYSFPDLLDYVERTDDGITK